MPVITLPDGSERSFDALVTVADIAQDIGPGLARAAGGYDPAIRLYDCRRCPFEAPIGGNDAVAVEALVQIAVRVVSH